MQKTGARHARQRDPGPVTLAMRVARKRDPGPLAFLLSAWPAVPPLALLPLILHKSPELGRHAGDILGLDATMCLAACITVTPLITVAKVKATRYRMIYGVWMFSIGAAGLLITLLLDHDTPRAVAGNSIQWTGSFLVLLLLPMTLTSNRRAQKVMGREWKRWQRGLLWTVYALVLLHLLALRSWDVLGGFTAVTVPMIYLRREKTRQSVAGWRKGGYSTGGWWTGLAVVGALWIAGAVILLTLTGVACAAAVHQ